MSVILPEKLLLRTELSRELTHLELDRNQQYAINPWSPLRYYKEGMIVIVAEEYFVTGMINTGSTSTSNINDSYTLSMWRATVDNGPNSFFNIAQWEPIGAQSLTGEISVMDSDNGLVPTNTTLIDFGDNLDVTVSGSTVRIDVNTNISTPWQYINPSNIFYENNVIIGYNNTITNDALQVIGNIWTSGDLIISGLVDGVDISNFKVAFDTHKHWISNDGGAPNLGDSQISDILIDFSSLQTGNVLKYNASLGKWVNSTGSSAPHNLGTHDNVSSNVDLPIMNENSLLYLDSTGNWNGIYINTNPTTGLSDFLAHNHNDLYYTQGNLQNSGQSQIHWDNITNTPVIPEYLHEILDVENYSSVATGSVLVWNNSTNLWEVQMSSLSGDHETLSNLLGGDVNGHYHLTEDESVFVSMFDVLTDGHITWDNNTLLYQGDVWENKNIVDLGETFNIPYSVQNIIYGDMYVDGTIINDNNIVVINGSIDLGSSGEILGSGTITLVEFYTVPQMDLILQPILANTHNHSNLDVLNHISDITDGHLTYNNESIAYLSDIISSTNNHEILNNLLGGDINGHYHLTETIHDIVNNFSEATDGTLLYNGNEVIAEGTAFKQTATINGNGTTDSYIIAHTLSTKDVIVQIYNISSGDTEVADVKRIDEDNVRIKFSAVVPSGISYKVLILG